MSLRGGKAERFDSLSPLVSLASAGPEDQVSILVEAMNNWSLRGAPGFVSSLASLRVTPGVSPSPLVEPTTPSYRCEVFVKSVTVVPYGTFNLQETLQNEDKTTPSNQQETAERQVVRCQGERH